MKTHYQLLGLDATAPADEIKRAFRREIARYHPDKVQHLGPEFQEIAATRAAELTEAYRVLTDTASRRQYDDALGTGVGFESTIPVLPRPPAPPAAARDDPAMKPTPGDAQAPPAPGDRGFHQELAATTGVLRQAAIGKLRDAVGRVSASAAPVSVAGFDAAFVIRPRRALFRKADAPVRLLARYVSHVDPAAVEEAWPVAMKSGAFDGVICVMLLGGGVSSAKELAIAVAEQRRRTRTAAPLVIPVDVRDWAALFPPEAPAVVRQLVQCLQDGS